MMGPARPVWSIWFVSFIFVGLAQPNKQDKPNKLNNGLLTLADFFSILLTRTIHDGSS